MPFRNILDQNFEKFTENMTITKPSKDTSFLNSDGEIGDLSGRCAFVVSQPDTEGFGCIDYKKNCVLIKEINRISKLTAIKTHVIMIADNYDLGTGQSYAREILNKLRYQYHENPWRDNLKWRAHFRRWAELLPVPSKTQIGLVAYFQTLEKREKNIQTVCKAGRFLKKYFGDVFTEPEIQKMALEWHNLHAPQELHITQDSDEIEKVYRGAYLGSCMHFKNNDFEGHCHPARVYGGNLDLGIAYIGSAEKVDGRCLVWPSRKIYYPKFYGDYHRLEGALIHAGFKPAEEEDFHGARLLRILNQNAGGSYVMPYVDVCESFNDAGDYLVLDDAGDYGCRNTNGLDKDVYSCDNCGNRATEDELYFVRHTLESVCEHCYNNHYFCCEITDEIYPDSERAETEDGYLVSQDGVMSDDEWFYCQFSDLWLLERQHEIVETDDGLQGSREKAEAKGYIFCAYTGIGTLDLSKLIKLSDGSYAHPDYFGKREYFENWLKAKGLTECSGAIREAA